ncbi:hypothetical protein [Streptomyces sp. NPDC002104]
MPQDDQVLILVDLDRGEEAAEDDHADLRLVWHRGFVRPGFAQTRWRAVNAPHLVALVRAGARFEKGVLVEREEVSAA